MQKPAAMGTAHVHRHSVQVSEKHNIHGPFTSTQNRGACVHTQEPNLWRPSILAWGEARAASICVLAAGRREISAWLRVHAVAGLGGGEAVLRGHALTWPHHCRAPLQGRIVMGTSRFRCQRRPQPPGADTKTSLFLREQQGNWREASCCHRCHRSAEVVWLLSGPQGAVPAQF